MLSSNNVSAINLSVADEDNLRSVKFYPILANNVFQQADSQKLFKLLCGLGARLPLLVIFATTWDIFTQNVLGITLGSSKPILGILVESWDLFGEYTWQDYLLLMRKLKISGFSKKIE